MATKFTDAEIDRMLNERKRFPADMSSGSDLRQKRGHSEREFDISGADGNRYRLILRQNSLNLLDFSAILAFCPPDSNAVFRLRRYNGKSHEHTNKIERETFYDFHIHSATERYQELGAKEEAYAVPCDRYGDLHGAIECLLHDCNFDAGQNPQLLLI